MVDELDQISKQAQDYYKKTPTTILLGSGASAAFGMSGMGKLSQHLKDKVKSSDLSTEEQKSWTKFCDELTKGIDLETALHSAKLSDELTNRVVAQTWELLHPEDLKVFYEAMLNPELFPLGKLLGHMFKSTVKELDIITPNYDRLAEYACEQENIHYYSGFSHGFKGRIAKKDYLTCSRQVNIWKVHGSLDWFIGPDNKIISLRNIDQIPKNWKPLIVTPGIEKYRNTHKEPYRTVIHESDDIMDKANSYLCIGFGFNDEHIQQKLVAHCANAKAAVIIITRTLTDATKKFISGDGVTDYLAIESGEDNTSNVYSSNLKDVTKIQGEYWSLGEFLKLIM